MRREMTVTFIWTGRDKPVREWISDRVDQMFEELTMEPNLVTSGAVYVEDKRSRR